LESKASDYSSGAFYDLFGEASCIFYLTASLVVTQLIQKEINTEITFYKLKNSYIGYVGRAVEPAVIPLGYDWKIGIAIISSFASREVFVGTLATIYSVKNDDEQTIKSRLAAETNPVLGGPLYQFKPIMSQ
jgi:ferrous iron transport protein B